MKTLKEKEHRIANIEEEIRFFYAEDVEEKFKEIFDEIDSEIKFARSLCRTKIKEIKK